MIFDSSLSITTEEPRSLPFLQAISLTPGTGSLWQPAYEYELSEEGFFFTLACITINLTRDVLGWFTLEMFLYGGQIFFGKTFDTP